MLRRPYLLIIIALYSLSVTGAFAQETRIPAKAPGTPSPDMEPCGCKDLAQIEAGIREVGHKIDAEKQYLTDHTGPINELKDSWKSEPRKYDDFTHAGSGFDTGLSGYGPVGKEAWVDVFSCEATWTEWAPRPPDPLDIRPPKEQLTHCMHVAVDQHEAVHRKKCLARKGGASDLFISLSHYLNFYTWQDGAQEDIEGNDAMLTYLIKQRTRLLCSCPYYNVRLEMAESMGQPGVYETLFSVQSTSAPDGTLESTELPYVEVSMRPEPQGMNGDGEGFAKGNFEDESGGAQVAQEKKSVLSFHVSTNGSGPIHAAIQMVSKNSTMNTTVTAGRIKVHADTEIVGNEAATTAKMNRIPGRPGTVVRQGRVPEEQASVVADFSALDAPTACSVPSAPSLTCHATLHVADEYRDALAFNNYGSSVGAALRAIAADRNTVIAACPLTR